MRVDQCMVCTPLSWLKVAYATSGHRREWGSNCKGRKDAILLREESPKGRGK